MKNPVPIHTSLSTTAACLLAFASQVVAQKTPPVESNSTRHSLDGSAKGGNISYQPGRGLTLSAANAQEFRVNISGQVQAGFYAIDDDDDLIDPANPLATPPSSGTDYDNSNGFHLWAARLRLGGNVFNEDITYFIQTDLIGADVVDAWAGVRMNEGANLRLGQQKMRSSLQADASLSDNVGEMVRRSIATQYYAGHRATGLLLEGNSGQLNWHAGAMNNSTAGVDNGIDTRADVVGPAAPNVATWGSGWNKNAENELCWTLGLSLGSDEGNSESWTEGDLAQANNPSWIFGASILLINEGADEEQSINLFAGVKSGTGIAAQAEVFLREEENDSDDSEGFYGQLSWTAPANGGVQYGGVARYSTIDWDNDLLGKVYELSLGINAYYHEHALKSQLQVSTFEVDDVDGETQRLDVFFTLVF